LTWSKAFVPPIPLPKGGTLETLHDARAFILDLPDKTQAMPAWQHATEALLLIGNTGGAEMFARIALMKALYPKGGPMFTGSGKGHRWGKVKLLRDR
jgi:hypothetical protein